ncbi:thiamine-phosphate synthase family protein [Halorubrum sp. CSM-61]|uniref:thiamine-phosphate synthase family protein n=1 Tax=Halorubrum sp. CSM-61 TaxID=2485838 RepID=UPI000F4D0F5B|nr:thiamine-phosphate synthase family protein [Halorubrum sp. CSM-61]
MSLHLPSEIVVERVLPTIRVCLAGELANREMTQQEVAEHIGVSQAAVSKYISGDVAVEERIEDHPLTAETVTRIAEGFASGHMDGYEALDELLALVRAFEDRGPVCELHEEAMPSLAGLGCDLCVRGTDERLAAERETLTDVRTAARILATAPGMATYVPNVGTNVGSALPGANDVSEVAAIPGRIYAVDGRVEIPANPEFGASRHVATVVLAAMAQDDGLRGAVNIATDDALLSTARARGLDPMEFDAEYDDRNQRLLDRFASRDAVPRVIYHSGAFGIEPITYVLGETAEDAARLAVSLLETVQEAE